MPTCIEDSYPRISSGSLKLGCCILCCVPCPAVFTPTLSKPRAAFTPSDFGTQVLEYKDVSEIADIVDQWYEKRFPPPRRRGDSGDRRRGRRGEEAHATASSTVSAPDAGADSTTSDINLGPETRQETEDGEAGGEAGGAGREDKVHRMNVDDTRDGDGDEDDRRGEQDGDQDEEGGIGDSGKLNNRLRHLQSNAILALRCSMKNLVELRGKCSRRKKTYPCLLPQPSGP